MTKTICDICGEEIPTSKLLDNIKNMNLCISSNGRIWDICTECQIKLNMWMIKRRSESEE